MNSIFSFTLRTLGKNRVRTAVTVAGVALAAALMVGVLVAWSSLTAFLHDQEVTSNGAWHVSATVTDAGALDAARSDERIAALSTVTEVGCAPLAADDAAYYGNYVAIEAIDSEFSQVGTVRIDEGRMPENSGEIVLFSLFRKTDLLGGEPCDIGSTVRFDLGLRAPVRADGQPVEGLPAYLDASFGYLDAEEDGGEFNETFTDMGVSREFTVVGFYSSTNMLTSANVGTMAFTCEDDGAPSAWKAAGEPEPTTAYVVTRGLSTEGDVVACARELFGDDAEIATHGTLLLYAGITGDRGIWRTMHWLVLVLALVIAGASASLIYNSFAISVADRTRQFGLLRSVGASRRQLRHAVLIEALLLAAVGVPCGVALGVGGSALVLDALAPLLENVLGGGASFGLHFDAGSIAAAVVLTVATVLVSAWLPSRRAAKANPVDAVRNIADVRDDDGLRAIAGAGSARRALAWEPCGIDVATRALGVPGRLAQRAVRRARGRGRVATASMSVAVVLLVTAGAWSMYLTKATDVVGGVAPYDVRATVYVDGLSCEGARVIYDELATVEGAHELGFSLSKTACVSVPASMANPALAETDSFQANGDGGLDMPVLVNYLSDDEFRAFAEEQGLDADDYLNAERPKGVALAQVYGNNGESYTANDAFLTTGVLSTWEYPQRKGYVASSETLLSDGRLGVVYSADDGSAVEEVARADGAQQGADIEIGALVDELPPAAERSYDCPTVVLPARALGSAGAELRSAAMTAAFSADDHARVAADMEAIVESLDDPGFVSDVTADRETQGMLALVVNVFSLCFAGILALIAVANVFNTMAFGLVLRRREFAMLRSVGMGDAAFRAMVAWECLGYCARGLAFGLALSVLVALGLHHAIGQSISGLAFSLPWGHVLAAVLVALAAAAVSTAYGLRRARAGNIIEALRSDMA